MATYENHTALLSGYSWDSLVVTYTFPSEEQAYWNFNPYYPGGFEPFTAGAADAVRAICRQLEELTNLQLVEVDGPADICFAYSDLGAGIGGATYAPDGSAIGGDVFLNVAGGYTDPLSWPGAFELLLHEFGHALGLEHPGAFDAGGNLPSGGDDLPVAEQNWQYTVMAYDGHPASNVVPMSYMLYDIAALQALYGANTFTRAGNDVYTFSAADLACIWDGGGDDTIDASESTAGVGIDLRQGTFSSIGARDNVSIAYDVVIENAIGGAGSDRLTGNAAANRLVGGGGTDVIDGKGGSDELEGGAGADIFVLAAGESDGDAILDFSAAAGDRIEFRGFGDGARLEHVSGETWRVVDGGVTETIRIVGTVTADSHNLPMQTDLPLSQAPAAPSGSYLGGTTYADILDGRPGDDRIMGWGGSDRLNGKAGNDWLDGGPQNDVLDGGAGADSLTGGTGADLFVFVKGEADGDWIHDFAAGSGDRIEFRGFGADARLEHVSGETWRVVDAGGAETIRITGTVTADSYGFAGGDSAGPGAEPAPPVLTSSAPATPSGTYKGGTSLADTLIGLPGDDKIMGWGGSDRLEGKGGNDWLDGGPQNDVLDGGAGADSLTGGTGADTFVFRRGEAHGDWVHDFDAAAGDRLRFEGYGAGSRLEDGGDGTWTIVFAGGSETIRVDGMVGGRDYLIA